MPVASNGAPPELAIVPRSAADYMEPILAWRWWNVVDVFDIIAHAMWPQLESFRVKGPWTPDEAQEARHVPPEPLQHDDNWKMDCPNCQGTTAQIDAAKLGTSIPCDAHLPNEDPKCERLSSPVSSLPSSLRPLPLFWPFVSTRSFRNPTRYSAANRGDRWRSSSIIFEASQARGYVIQRRGSWGHSGPNRQDQK